MDAAMKDEKNMSLDDLIKRDKLKKKKPFGQKQQQAKPAGGIRAKMQKMKANKGGRLQGGRPRFQGKELRAAGPPQSARSNNQVQRAPKDRPLNKPLRTGNMIKKRRGENLQQEGRKLNRVPMKSGRGNIQGGGQQPGGPRNRGSDSRKMPRGPMGQSAGNRPPSGRVRGLYNKQERGGLAQDQRRRRLLAQPKTVNIRGEKQQVLRQSQVALKVRNIDEDQVTNNDLKKLFAKIGELVVCRFDRNDFGVFLGSATVEYRRPEDAKRAIEEYHEAFLDDKVLTVEYDMVQAKSSLGGPGISLDGSGNKSGPVLRKDPNSTGKGKTLRLK